MIIIVVMYLKMEWCLICSIYVRWFKIICKIIKNDFNFNILVIYFWFLYLLKLMRLYYVLYMIYIY